MSDVQVAGIEGRIEAWFLAQLGRTGREVAVVEGIIL